MARLGGAQRGATPTLHENIAPTWTDIAAAQASASYATSGLVHWIRDVSGLSSEWQTIKETLEPTWKEEDKWMLNFLPLVARTAGHFVPELSKDEFISQVQAMDAEAYRGLLEQSEDYKMYVENEAMRAARLAELGYQNTDSITGVVGVFGAGMAGAMTEPFNLAMTATPVAPFAWAARGATAAKIAHNARLGITARTQFTKRQFWGKEGILRTAGKHAALDSAYIAPFVASAYYMDADYLNSIGLTEGAAQDMAMERWLDIPMSGALRGVGSLGFDLLRPRGMMVGIEPRPHVSPRIDGDPEGVEDVVWNNGTKKYEWRRRGLLPRPAATNIGPQYRPPSTPPPPLNRLSADEQQIIGGIANADGLAGVNNRANRRKWFKNGKVSSKAPKQIKEAAENYRRIINDGFSQEEVDKINTLTSLKRGDYGGDIFEADGDGVFRLRGDVPSGVREVAVMVKIKKMNRAIKDYMSGDINSYDKADLLDIGARQGVDLSDLLDDVGAVNGSRRVRFKDSVDQGFIDAMDRQYRSPREAAAQKVLAQEKIPDNLFIGYTPAKKPITFGDMVKEAPVRLPFKQGVAQKRLMGGLTKGQAQERFAAMLDFYYRGKQSFTLDEAQTVVAKFNVEAGAGGDLKLEDLFDYVELTGEYIPKKNPSDAAFAAHFGKTGSGRYGLKPEAKNLREFYISLDEGGFFTKGDLQSTAFSREEGEQFIEGLGGGRKFDDVFSRRGNHYYLKDTSVVDDIEPPEPPPPSAVEAADADELSLAARQSPVPPPEEVSGQSIAEARERLEQGLGVGGGDDVVNIEGVGVAHRITTDSASVKTAAEDFQHKLGANERGSIGTLDETGGWDEAQGDGMMFYRANNGDLIVVDGHQRLSLAQRLASDDGVAKKLHGLELRESEGWTREAARAYAAFRNLNGPDIRKDAPFWEAAFYWANVRKNSAAAAVHEAVQNKMNKDAGAALTVGENISRLPPDVFEMAFANRGTIRPEYADMVYLYTQTLPATKRGDMQRDIIQWLITNGVESRADVEYKIKFLLSWANDIKENKSGSLFGDAVESERANIFSALMRGVVSKFNASGKVGGAMARHGDQAQEAGIADVAKDKATKLRDESKLAAGELSRLGHLTGTAEGAIMRQYIGKVQEGMETAVAIKEMVSVYNGIPFDENGIKVLEIDANGEVVYGQVDVGKAADDILPQAESKQEGAPPKQAEAQKELTGDDVNAVIAKQSSEPIEVGTTAGGNKVFIANDGEVMAVIELRDGITLQESKAAGEAGGDDGVLNVESFNVDNPNMADDIAKFANDLISGKKAGSKDGQSGGEGKTPLESGEVIDNDGIVKDYTAQIERRKELESAARKTERDDEARRKREIEARRGNFSLKSSDGEDLNQGVFFDKSGNIKNRQSGGELHSAEVAVGRVLSSAARLGIPTEIVAKMFGAAGRANEMRIVLPRDRATIPLFAHESIHHLWLSGAISGNTYGAMVKAGKRLVERLGREDLLADKAIYDDVVRERGFTLKDEEYASIFAEWWAGGEKDAAGRTATNINEKLLAGDDLTSWERVYNFLREAWDALSAVFTDEGQARLFMRKFARGELDVAGMERRFGERAAVMNLWHGAKRAWDDPKAFWDFIGSGTNVRNEGAGLYLTENKAKAGFYTKTQNDGDEPMLLNIRLDSGDRDFKWLDWRGKLTEQEVKKLRSALSKHLDEGKDGDKVAQRAIKQSEEFSFIYDRITRAAGSDVQASKIIADAGFDGWHSLGFDSKRQKDYVIVNPAIVDRADADRLAKFTLDQMSPEEYRKLKAAEQKRLKEAADREKARIALAEEQGIFKLQGALPEGVTPDGLRQMSFFNQAPQAIPDTEIISRNGVWIVREAGKPIGTAKTKQQALKMAQEYQPTPLFGGGSDGALWKVGDWEMRGGDDGYEVLKAGEVIGRYDTQDKAAKAMEDMMGGDKSREREIMEKCLLK